MATRAAWLCLLLPACSAGPDASLVTMQDSAGVIVVRNSATPRPTVSLGQPTYAAPTTGESVGTVDAAVLLGDTLLLIGDGSNGAVTVFDTLGQTRRTLTRAGNGPGEVAMLAGLWALEGDSVLVFDFARRRLLTLSASRGLLRESGLPDAAAGAFLQPVGVLANGLVLAARRVFAGSAVEGLDVRRDSSTYVSLDPANGAIREQLGTYASFETYNVFVGNDRGPAVQRQGLPFGRGTTVRPFGDGLLVADNAAYALEIRTLRGALVRRITRPVAPVPVSEADLEHRQTAFARLLEQDPDFSPEARERLLADSRRAPHAPTHPVFGTVMVGRDLSIWVASAGATDSGEVSYAVFDSTGRYRVEVQLPPRTWLAQVTGSAIVALSEQETGEPVVYVYDRPREARFDRD